MSRPSVDKIIIPFCKPDYTFEEKQAADEALNFGKLEGGGKFTKRCESLLENNNACNKALIVPSCTAALEMIALALELKPGDEIIMPSFTFVSTANAFALRGAIPVFVDIDEDTLNIDPTLVEAAITDKTRAIMVVHYAGVACDMSRLKELSKRYKLTLLEDAAQGIHAYWKDEALGSIGTFGAFSFHHTKNISCGEGGALLINDPAYIRQSNIIRDKGTNRPDFLEGTVSKYEWQNLGSSYLLSELSSAVLSAQLKRVQELTKSRLTLWHNYLGETQSLQDVRAPKIPDYAKHNAHIFHLRLPTLESRNSLVYFMRERGVVAAPHYVPLHLTPGGKRLGRASGNLENTIEASNSLIRLPLYSSMTEDEQSVVIDQLNSFMQKHTF